MMGNLKIELNLRGRSSFVVSNSGDLGKGDKFVSVIEEVLCYYNFRKLLYFKAGPDELLRPIRGCDWVAPFLE
jgi:hypothetical protein